MANAQESLIRNLVREEVQKAMDNLIPREIAPMKTKLDTLVTTVRSFYSNGSGGPPGALEIWREEDKVRFSKLEEAAEVSKENNEAFKDFIRSYIEERDNRKRRFRQAIGAGKWIGPIIGSAILTLAGFVYHAVSPVCRYVWDDYMKHHPALVEQMERNH